MCFNYIYNEDIRFGLGGQMSVSDVGFQVNNFSLDRLILIKLQIKQDCINT